MTDSELIKEMIKNAQTGEMTRKTAITIAASMISAFKAIGSDEQGLDICLALGELSLTETQHLELWAHVARTITNEALERKL